MRVIQQTTTFRRALAIALLIGPCIFVIPRKCLSAQDLVPQPAPATISISLQPALGGEIGDILQLTAATNGSNVRWIVSDPGLQMIPVIVLKDSKTAVLIGKKAGVYRVWAYTSQGDMPTEPAVCIVTIAGGAPPAPPAPPTPPTPPTPPAPVTKTNAFVIAIVDHSKITPAIGEVLATVGQEINGKGHKWREIEVSNPVVSDRAYTQYIAQAGGAPCILISDFNSKLLKAAPFPSDKASLLKLVADVTGN
jgi:hypothetical protein